MSYITFGDLDRAKFSLAIKREIECFGEMLELTREKAMGGDDFWLEWHLNLCFNVSREKSSTIARNIRGTAEDDLEK